MNLFIPFYITSGFVGIILLLALWDIVSYKNKKLKNTPKVSFVIPAYKAHNTINKTISSILKQNYPKNKIEIIVYASGPKLKKYKLPKKVKLIKRKGKVEKALAVNRAAKKVKSNFIYIIDADTILDKDVLKKTMVRFDNENIGAVTASRVAIYTGLWSLLQRAEYAMTNFVLTSYNKLGSTVGLFGCSMCFRKKAFNKIKGIARIPAQDFDAGLRLVEEKYKLKCAFTAKAYTYSPGFLKWIKQRLRWMRGFSLALLNHIKIFIKEPFGLLFTLIYLGMGITAAINYFINAGFFQSLISLILLLISFKIPIIAAFAIITGTFGWTLYDRIILIAFYSCLSIPYILYPYKKQDILKLPLIFVYSLIYLPLFTITGIIGFVMALKDKIQGKEIIKW
jgi:cellulose synthase/poly-beta-1,6-N-acetylglucosamine synthase-like glycosyltransferase